MLAVYLALGHSAAAEAAHNDPAAAEVAHNDSAAVAAEEIG